LNNMPKFEIKEYPDPILRKECNDVEEITPEIKELILSMIEIQDEKNGLGLAAPQVGVSQKIIVIGENAYINPKILNKSKDTIIFEEGCLSFPGLFLKIKRPREVEIEAINENGEKIKISGFGNFIVREKRSRKGRNPQTGEEIQISARRVLTFKPSQVLRKALNTV